MSPFEVVFYKESDGRCPVLEWLDHLPKRVEAKARMRIKRLTELGHELRRPEADYLRDGIYELRWRIQSVNYRILYFFGGKQFVVLAHALTKEDFIPARDIDLALQQKRTFEINPKGHIFGGEE